MPKKSPSKIEVLAWALCQLAGDMYQFEINADAWELHIYDSIDTEREFSITEEQSHKVEKSFESALSEHIRDPEDRKAFVVRLAVERFRPSGSGAASGGQSG